LTATKSTAKLLKYWDTLLAEVRPLSWWYNPEKVWLDTPRWTDDLNRAVTLYPFGISIEFHARADGKYMIYIGEQFYINHWFNFDELALGLSVTFVAWKTATD
jgi:hypothetical protein